MTKFELKYFILESFFDLNEEASRFTAPSVVQDVVFVYNGCRFPIVDYELQFSVEYYKMSDNLGLKLKC